MSPRIVASSTVIPKDGWHRRSVSGAALGEAERERPATESRRDRLIADAMTGLISSVYMVSAADAAGPADEKAEG